MFGTKAKDQFTIIGAQVAYAQTFGEDKFSFGFTPNASLAFVFHENGNSFVLDTGIDLGMRFKLNDKFSVFTGAKLSLFDFVNNSGKDESDWTLSGIKWDQYPEGGTTLGLGLTFSPAPNLVIGAEITEFVGRFFTVDVGNMEAGTELADSNSNNLGDWAFSFFRDLKFGLTISYKF